MWLRSFIGSGLAAAFLMPGALWAAIDAEIILDRRDGEMSLFIAMPAPALETVFDHGAEALLGADGTVDIDKLYDGTFLAADDIFQGVRVRIGGEDVPVEALSMMLHDPNYLPRFADPIDGQISIAVCTSPETVRGMSLPELRAYMGFFAWQVDAHEAVEIVFPETGRSDLTVVVRDNVDFRDVGERSVVLGDGGAIVVPAASDLAPAGPLRLLFAGGAGVLLLLAIGTFFLMRGSNEAANTT